METAQPRKIITHAEQKVKEKMCGKMTKNVYPDLYILRIDSPGFRWYNKDTIKERRTRHVSGFLGNRGRPLGRGRSGTRRGRGVILFPLEKNQKKCLTKA